MNDVLDVTALLRQDPHALNRPLTARCVGLAAEVGKSPRADMRKVVADLRELISLDGPTKAEAIRDIIDRQYRMKLTPCGLAAAAGLHVDEAECEFERRFGMSIHDYLTDRRALEGLALLRAGDKVESAARSVGFKEGKRHFYAAFRKLTGTTPGALRKRERERQRP